MKKQTQLTAFFSKEALSKQSMTLASSTNAAGDRGTLATKEDKNNNNKTTMDASGNGNENSKHAPKRISSSPTQSNYPLNIHPKNVHSQQDSPKITATHSIEASSFINKEGSCRENAIYVADSADEMEQTRGMSPPINSAESMSLSSIANSTRTTDLVETPLQNIVNTPTEDFSQMKRSPKKRIHGQLFQDESVGSTGIGGPRKKRVQGELVGEESVSGIGGPRKTRAKRELVGKEGVQSTEIEGTGPSKTRAQREVVGEEIDVAFNDESFEESQDGEEDDVDDEEEDCDEDAAEWMRSTLNSLRSHQPKVITIPSPSKKILYMNHATIVRTLLDKVVVPRAKKIFQKLLDDGFILDPTGPHEKDILFESKLSQSNAVVYLIINSLSGAIKKAGSTKNAKRRMELSVAKGTVPDDQWKMLEIFNLDLLTEEVDQYLQTEAFYNLLDAIISHADCPEPMRHMFQSHLHRGGAELGFKKNIILQVVELGAKLHFGTSRQDFELLMFDDQQYKQRNECVRSAFEDHIRPKLEKIYGRDKLVDIELVSSWPPAASKTLKNGDPRLFSTQVALECIVDHPVNMEEANTVPFPANPDATTQEEQYSTKEYSLKHRADGRRKLKRKVDSLKEYQLLFLDSNKFLFEDGPGGPRIQGSGGSTLEILVSQGYRVECVVWDCEMILLSSTKKVIALHCPFCLVAPAKTRGMDHILRRGMLVQLSIMIRAWCKRKSTSSLPQSTFGDAVLGGYAYEQARTALHTSRIASAAVVRDVLTPESTLAMVQNDIRKPPLNEGITYPVAKNLKVKVARDAAIQAGEKSKPSMDYNILFKYRTLNILRLQPDQLNQKQSTALYNRINALFQEDGVADTAIKARWKTLRKDYLCPESVLLRAINAVTPKKKGNHERFLKTPEEWEVYEAEKRAIQALEIGTPFWVRCKKNTMRPPVWPENQGHPVFSSQTYEGIRKPYRKTPISVNMVTANGKKNGPGIKSRNEGFVLCRKVPRDYTVVNQFTKKK